MYCTSKNSDFCSVYDMVQSFSFIYQNRMNLIGKLAMMCAAIDLHKIGTVL